MRFSEKNKHYNNCIYCVFLGNHTSKDFKEFYCKLLKNHEDIIWFNKKMEEFATKGNTPPRCEYCTIRNIRMKEHDNK